MKIDSSCNLIRKYLICFKSLFLMMSNNFQPRVSIGMPIYNEGKHLEEALTSILSQTYSNIELIIVDNCSDDQSNLICKKFIEADNRIRYIKNKHNIGAGNNFVKALSIASSSDSKYYCYARGDGFTRRIQ